MGFLSQLGGAAYGPEVGKDVSCTGETNVDGLGEGEVADVIKEHGKCDGEGGLEGGRGDDGVSHRGCDIGCGVWVV